MFYLLLACATGAESTPIDDTGPTVAPSAAPQVQVWEYLCDEDAPPWTMPLGTVIGIAHIREINGVAFTSPETLTLAPDRDTPLVESGSPLEYCDGGHTGGRIVVTYIP